MQALIRESWASLYRFDLQPQFLPDYEVANWYVSTHPESHFVNNLIVARPAADRRFALFNNQLSIHRAGSASEQHEIRSAGELRSVLQDTLGLNLPDAPDLNEVLARATQRTAAA